MGFGSLLKRAFSGVQEWDRRNMYGSDYKEKAAALAQLNELNVKAKLLENQDKFERIQQMRAEMAQRSADRENQQAGAAFEGAVKLGSSLDPTPIPGFVSPVNPNVSADEVDPTNILHSPGEGTIEPELPSHIKSRLRPEDQGVLGTAIRTGRERRKTLEDQQKRLFEANLGVKELQDDRTRADIGRLNRSGTGGGGTAYSPINGGVGARDGVFGSMVLNKRTGQLEFMGVDNFTPSSTKPNQGSRDALYGVATTYDNLKEVERTIEKATTILGPAAGRIALGENRWLGSEGLTPPQIEALTAMDRATMMAAFANGGKQLTGIELETFLRQYPQASDNLTAIRTKLQFLKRALKKEAAKRKATLTGPEIASFSDSGAIFSNEVFAPDDAPVSSGVEIGPDGVLRRKR